MGPEVVVVGDVNIDIITNPLSGDAVKALREGRESEIISNFTLSLGGNAANCALALSKLGIKTRLIGALSDDPISRWLIEFLEENKVEFHRCYKNTPSGITFAITYEEGTRTFISSFGSNQFLSLEDIKLELIEGKHLHRAGYWWAPKFMGDATRQLFQIAREKGLSTSLDIGWDPQGWTEKRRDALLYCLELCDIFFLNNKELEALTQSQIDEGAELILRRGTKVIGLHYGAEGCKIYFNNNSLMIPSYKVPLRNPTGTGDIFNAAFIYGYLMEWDFEQIGKFANACAALHLSDQTALYPTLKEVQHFMKSYNNEV